jgi:hypothetical protein
MRATGSICQCPAFNFPAGRQFSGTGQSISIVTAFWCEPKNTFYRLLKSASAENRHRQSKPNLKFT